MPLPREWSFPADEHDEAIKTERDPAVRWRAQAKRPQQMAELGLLIFRGHSQGLEHFCLQLRLVNSNAASTDFDAIQDNIIGIARISPNSFGQAAGDPPLSVG